MKRVEDTEPGRFYRRSRGAGGSYFIRPKISAEKYVKRLRKRKRPTCSEYALILDHERNPDFVLLKRINRGIDPMTGDRYETRHFVLVPPSLELREVKSRPGFR